MFLQLIQHWGPNADNLGHFLGRLAIVLLYSSSKDGKLCPGVSNILCEVDFDYLDMSGCHHMPPKNFIGEYFVGSLFMNSQVARH
jgi:hypothetical protein